MWSSHSCSQRLQRSQDRASGARYNGAKHAFIEQPSGESVVTVNDASGSVEALQTAINNVRSANPDKVIVIRLKKGATYIVSGAGIALDSHRPGKRCRRSRADHAYCFCDSNGPVMGDGDGDTAPDWEITGALTLNLRAERRGG
ncbi:MAG: hypothetical protein J2P21_24770 [Chloracidobacterium sp.]|nr:hypothetical protein [Chloracidobacterium sp.]